MCHDPNMHLKVLLINGEETVERHVFDGRLSFSKNLTGHKTEP